jgi:hypothetical protein
MPTTNTSKTIDRLIAQKTDSSEMFTAAELISEIRTQFPALISVPYRDMREYIHTAMRGYCVVRQYERTSIYFETPTSGMVNAFVYHPSDVDPNDYVSHEIRNAAQTTATAAVRPSATVGDPWDALDAPQPAKATQRPPVGKPPLNPPLTLENFPSIPTPNDGVVDKNDFVYSHQKAAPIQYVDPIDAMGTVLLGKDYTAHLVETNLSLIYAMVEKGQIVLRAESASTMDNPTVLMLNDDWEIRIPSSLFNEAGIVGSRYKAFMGDKVILLSGKR